MFQKNQQVQYKCQGTGKRQVVTGAKEVATMMVVDEIAATTAETEALPETTAVEIEATLETVTATTLGIETGATVESAEVEAENSATTVPGREAQAETRLGTEEGTNLTDGITRFQ